MRVYQKHCVILIALATLFTMGCSSFNALFRSVEKPFGQDQSEIDTIILDEAKEAYQSGKTSLAEERYLEFVERNQRSQNKVALAHAYSQLGRIAHEKGDYKSGNRYFEKAIELTPENLDLFGMYGESLYVQKEYPRAETLFRQAIRVAPEDSRFQIMLGRTLAQQKQYLLGQRYLKQALGEQGAYEEMAQIYNSHKEYDKATLAMAKARESHTRQRQLAVNSGSDNGGRTSGSKDSFGKDSPHDHAGHVVSNPQNGQLGNTMPKPQPPGTMPMQSYQPQQAAPPRQGQATAMQPTMQPVVIPQQTVSGEQVSMQQYPGQQYPVQQPNSQFPQQQPVASANQSYSYLPPAPMNPAGVQQVPYPTTNMPQQVMPQQAPGANPQWQQENRPPYGFAATDQAPPAFVPHSEMQTSSGSFQQNGQEVAWYPNYSQPQPNVLPPTNPLAENPDSAWQTPTWPPYPAATPTYGRQDSASQNPVFSGFSE